MSRSRLAPLKGLSIVRLELQAAVLAVRLASVVKTSLSYTLDGVVYWSDSKVVIQYLRSQSRRFNTFVANHVAEVHDLSDIGQWRHVPGSLNPADVCSRGTCLDGLISLRSWWEGPKFLRDDQRSWPSQDGFTALSLDDPELRKSTEPVAVYACSTTVAVLPCPGRFSSLLRYKRIVAWVLRFLNNLYSRHGVKGFRSTETGPLTGSELSEAHNTIVRECQFTHFRSEIDALRAGKGLHSSISLLQLSPFLDSDNILKVNGRIRAATVSTSVKFPIILSNKDPLANLIIARTHTECAHAGLEHTLNLVRCQYWIPKARSLIKGVLRRCAFCAKRRARPSAPKMADLPADRFNTTLPFHIVGLDYFGPLEVHKLRKTEKRYVLLITCMSTRAVHLEISHSMTTDSFLLALRRFFARRGRPAKIYSDNGKNFVGGERELQRSLEEWNQSQISDALSQHHINWHFNPPSSPHMGGVWERLVASVKRSLKAVLGRLRLTDEVLETVMAEMEFLVNSRPITYVSSDVRDVEALTPNHFLLGRVGANLSPGVFTKNDVIGRKHWRQSQALVNQLWRRWTKEFIPSLLRRQKWSSETDNFKEDEVVLMVDDCQPRGHWPLARVVKTHPGQDGRVRVVEVRTANGSIYKRPVAKLCRLP